MSDVVERGVYAQFLSYGVYLGYNDFYGIAVGGVRPNIGTKCDTLFEILH